AGEPDGGVVERIRACRVCAQAGEPDGASGLARVAVGGVFALGLPEVDRLFAERFAAVALATDPRAAGQAHLRIIAAAAHRRGDATIAIAAAGGDAAVAAAALGGRRIDGDHRDHRNGENGQGDAAHVEYSDGLVPSRAATHHAFLDYR